MRHLLGFDIGGTKCAVVLGAVRDDGNLEILGRTAFATAGAPRPILDRLADAAGELVRCHGAVPVAAGVACGGPLDAASGLVLSPPNLPGWDRVPVVALLKARLGIPVGLENDANAGALAEWRWGAGRGARSLVFITCGTGLGSGLVLDGRLYRGATGNAGEIGHWRLADDGPEGFGKRGSFEGFCSGGGLARFARERTGRDLGAAEICAAARAGDAACAAVVAESGRRLGQGLALLADVLDPEVIAIGGVFARAHDLFAAAVAAGLARDALPPIAASCRIVPALLGEAIGDHAALGVALEVQP